MTWEAWATIAVVGLILYLLTGLHFLLFGISIAVAASAGSRRNSGIRRT